MSKLNERGLATFLREVNKLINTKINALDIKAKAKEIPIEDTSNVFTATNVEEALVENKASITSIESNISKSESTSYQTVNGVKEFEPKDGYVDNILIEGNTLTNILSQQYAVARNIADIVPNSTVDNMKNGIKITFNSDLTTASGYCVFQVGNTQSCNMLKPSTTYTVVYDCNTNFKGLNSDMFISKNDSTSKLTNVVDGVVFKNGKNAFTIQTIDNIPVLDDNDGGFYALQLGINKSERTAGAYCQISNVMIIEGDYTQNPLGFFEGLASIGQGDKIEILTRNENLFNFEKRWQKASPITYEILDNNSINVSKLNGGVYDYVGYEFELIPNARYEIGATVANNINTLCGIGVKKKGSDLGVYPDITPNRPKLEIVVPENGIIRLNFYPTLGTTDDATLTARDIFIRKIENKNNPYTESKSDKKQILTALRSLPNGVKDTIERRGNKYYKIQRCGQITLNGSNAWSSDSAKWNETTVKPFVAGAIPNAKVDGNNVNFFCNSFETRNIHNESNTVEGIYYSSGLNIHVRILKSKLSTVDLTGIKAYLDRNPITIVYELAEPIITELVNFNPRTFEGTTIILVNSGVVQGDCSFEVTNSLGSSVDAIQDKLSSVEDGLVEASKDSIKKGGTFEGVVVAQSNTNYTTAQIRNVIMSTSDPTENIGNDGDIFIKYTV